MLLVLLTHPSTASMSRAYTRYDFVNAEETELSERFENMQLVEFWELTAGLLCARQEVSSIICLWLGTS